MRIRKPARSAQAADADGSAYRVLARARAAGASLGLRRACR
jgi:hypothetical protein